MDGIIDDSRHKTNITLSNVAHEATSGNDPVYWVALRLVGRVFVCSLLLLATSPSQPADVPTAKAKPGTHGIFSKKSLPTSRSATQ